MCLTSGPAKLSTTKILSGKIDDAYHLLAYSNTVENISGKPNSMILAIPGKVTEEDFYDTTAYAKFLEVIEESQRARYESKSLSRSFDTLSMDDEVVNFQVGMYNVFVSDSASNIGKAISTLPSEKRPEINPEILSFLENHYKGWSFVIACFDGDKKMEAQPIMLKFKPIDSNILYFPGMDAHDGGAPNLDEKVWVDHFLMTMGEKGSDVDFGNLSIPEIFAGKKFFGMSYSGKHQNGDWYVNVDNGLNLNRSSIPLIKKPEVHEDHTTA